MFCRRLVAAIIFTAFVFAAGATLRLAMVESSGRRQRPALGASEWTRAVRLNPRDSSAWMALGLAAEQAGDVQRASEYLLRAEKVDRQYLPAWTAANFFFRHAGEAEFWRAAARAAAMSYDDPAPLIDLVDHRAPRAAAALERLGDTPRLERGYLHFLIGQSRWPEAQVVAARLAARKDSQDGELLLYFTDGLIAAGKAQAALEFAHAHAGALTNGDFRTQPSGHGFDWRVQAPPAGAARWEPARLRFWLAKSTPDACVLLGQWVVFVPGNYRLQVQYRTAGLEEQTGLRWVVSRGGIAEVSGPALARAADRERKTGWSFELRKGGVYQLQLVYIRVPGTIHVEGRVEFASVGLEIL